MPRSAYVLDETAINNGTRIRLRAKKPERTADLELDVFDDDDVVYGVIGCDLPLEIPIDEKLRWEPFSADQEIAALVRAVVRGGFAERVWRDRQVAAIRSEATIEVDGKPVRFSHFVGGHGSTRKLPFEEFVYAPYTDKNAAGTAGGSVSDAGQ